MAHPQSLADAEKTAATILTQLSLLQATMKSHGDAKVQLDEAQKRLGATAGQLGDVAKSVAELIATLKAVDAGRILQAVKAGEDRIVQQTQGVQSNLTKALAESDTRTLAGFTSATRSVVDELLAKAVSLVRDDLTTGHQRLAGRVWFAVAASFVSAVMSGAVLLHIATTVARK